jgi:hypothetical protein
MNDAEYFEKHGCVLVRNFFDEQTIFVVSKYFENKIRRGEWVEISKKEDPNSRYAYYADPLIEVFLESSKEAVEDATGKNLLPTYSYSRIYQPGEEHAPHVDSSSCEISVTVNVATRGEFSPIYTQYGQNDPEKHVLNPGDAVIYMGCDVLHWRRLLKDNQLNVQFMMHYVDKDGPNAEYAKDKRINYGFNSDTRSQ